MKAKNVIDLKEKYADGKIVQLIVWQLPEPIPGSSHSFKYRLYCGRSGKCIVRYDNERGKGDHKHMGDEEVEYNFISLEQLITDFMQDVERLSGDTHHE